ncbi:MAG: hypothetical protein VYC39_17260 [Myxococcota bacterium]|nr:hypothetical protein [Myxococcota bacterium]
MFPKLLSFIEQGKFEPLKSFIQRHLLISEENPQPDISTRTLFSGILKITRSLGLEKTVDLTDLVTNSEILGEQLPLLTAALDFITGKTDGKSRYETGDAAAHFIRVCDPDHLLSAIELLTSFESPSRPGEMWIDVMLKEIAVVVDNQKLDEFLDAFEQDAEKGRPAVINIIAQLMGLIRQSSFSISQVETLLDSAVYPILSDELRPNVERMVTLLEEVTAPDAGILVPLQRSIDCGMHSPAERDVIIGFLYDLLFSQDIGARDALISVAELVSIEDSKFLLGIVSDLIGSIRSDRLARDELLELFALMLQQPDVNALLPIVSELIAEEIFTELLVAIQSILGDCNRA